jgi:hypothetical protein
MANGIPTGEQNTANLELIANKDASNGYTGLTLFKINFKNVANTFTSFFINSNTASRTYTYQDKDGTVALSSDTHDATSKTTPIDADELSLIDSAASNVLNKLTWANLKATLKVYFDTLYSPVVKITHVADVKASGTNGGTNSVGTQTRTLNTSLINTVSGVSLASNRIVGLPAGTYKGWYIAPAAYVSGHQAWLYNVTTAATISGTISTNQYAEPTPYYTTNACTHYFSFTIANTTTIELKHFTAISVASYGLGVSASSGQGEIYSQLFLEKIA